jgi:hypothetical protein
MKKLLKLILFLHLLVLALLCEAIHLIAYAGERIAEAIRWAWSPEQSRNNGYPFSYKN